MQSYLASIKMGFVHIYLQKLFTEYNGVELWVSVYKRQWGAVVKALAWKQEDSRYRSWLWVTLGLSFFLSHRLERWKTLIYQSTLEQCGSLQSIMFSEEDFILNWTKFDMIIITIIMYRLLCQKYPSFPQKEKIWILLKHETSQGK